MALSRSGLWRLSRATPSATSTRSWSVPRAFALATGANVPGAGPHCGVRVGDLQTPALVVDTAALDHNLTTMAEALPPPRLRPHVKAHKCTALARRQAELGATKFTCATIREVEGMAAAGL